MSSAVAIKSNKKYNIKYKRDTIRYRIVFGSKVLCNGMAMKSYCHIFSVLVFVTLAILFLQKIIKKWKKKGVMQYFHFFVTLLR